MEKIQKLMSHNIVAVRVGESLSRAHQMMRENEIRHLPVVDKDDQIIGILSSKDLPPLSELSEVQVDFYMKAPVVTVHQDLPLKKVIYQMLENKISSIIVTNENNDAVGIVTTEDLLWYFVTRLEKESAAENSITKRLFDSDTIGKVAYQISMAGI